MSIIQYGKVFHGVMVCKEKCPYSRMKCNFQEFCQSGGEGAGEERVIS